MEISYTLPLSKAFTRMREELFTRFDLNKWINIGFTAFLAGLTDFSGNSANSGNVKNKSQNWDMIFGFPEKVKEWISANPNLTMLIIVGIVLLIAIIVLLQWLSSRGKFMFLHNVVERTDDVRKPWNDYRELGNSLFLWRLVFGWLSMVIIGLFFYFSFTEIREIYYSKGNFTAIFWELAGRIFIFIALAVIVGCISLFLNDFVVPLMAKHNLKTTPAWYKFMMLFSKYPGYFIMYCLFIFGLTVLVGIVVVLAGLLTCCIGFVILVIPVVGSIVLLPVSYTYRALSINFLAQFGEDFDLTDRLPENEPQPVE